MVPESKIDLRAWRDRFPEKVDRYSKGHWFLTQTLEKIGIQVASRKLSQPSYYLAFLLMIGVWKNPHAGEAEKTIVNIASNKLAIVQQVVDQALKIYHEQIEPSSSPEEKTEATLIDLIGGLIGFGRATGGRAMVSAVLRFLDPVRYGTVDYRNWAVLSNTECEAFSGPVLAPLATTLRETSTIPIDTGHYLNYLHAIRELAAQIGMTAADVDMALFAYSDGLVPLSRAGMEVPRQLSDRKAMRIMQIVDEIVEAVIRVPRQRLRADRFRETMLRYAKAGDYLRMYEYAKAAMRSVAPPTGARKTIETEFWRIETIVRDEE